MGIKTRTHIDCFKVYINLNIETKYDALKDWSEKDIQMKNEREREDISIDTRVLVISVDWQIYRAKTFGKEKGDGLIVNEEKKSNKNSCNIASTFVKGIARCLRILL